MTHEQAFLAAICAAPDDDVPRLIYADYLEEQGQAERAELIRLQIKLARYEAHTAPLHPLRHYERELLRHIPVPASLWLSTRLPKNDGDEEYGWYFRRGFIEVVTCPCQEWLLHGPAIVEEVPTVREVRLSDKMPSLENHYPYLDYPWGWVVGRRGCNGAGFLPAVIRSYLGGDVRIDGKNWRYRRRDTAINALSAACIAYAHSRHSHSKFICGACRRQE